MTIVVNLDLMLVKRKMKSKTLAAKIGLSEQNLSLLKSGKVKGVRFSTLNKICEVLDCQPGDILAYIDDGHHDQIDAPPEDALSLKLEGSSALT